MHIAIFILLLCPLFSCERAASPDSEPMPEPANTTNYLALGDSYTIGESVAPDERWPVVLAARRGWLPPTIVAKTGWTVSELDAGIDRQIPEGSTYDHVSLLIGVNDEFRGGTIEQYEPDFRAMLERAIAFAGGESSRTFVVSIPDYGVTPFAQNRGPEQIAARIDAFNEVARQVSEARGVTFVDITPYSRQNAQQVAPDGLHPSAEQYRGWVELMDESL